jgi:hypothetical protein
VALCEEPLRSSGARDAAGLGAPAVLLARWRTATLAASVAHGPRAHALQMASAQAFLSSAEVALNMPWLRPDAWGADASAAGEPACSRCLNRDQERSSCQSYRPNSTSISKVYATRVAYALGLLAACIATVHTPATAGVDDARFRSTGH